MVFDGIFKKPITFCPWTQAPRCDGFCLPDVLGSQKCDGFCFAFNFGTKQERRFSNYLQHCSRSNLGWFQNLNSLLSCIHLPVFEGQQIPSQLSFSSIHSPSIVGSLRDLNSQIVSGHSLCNFGTSPPPKKDSSCSTKSFFSSTGRLQSPSYFSAYSSFNIFFVFQNTEKRVLFASVL